jgi:hypothetical protein
MTPTCTTSHTLPAAARHRRAQTAPRTVKRQYYGTKKALKDSIMVQRQSAPRPDCPPHRSTVKRESHSIMVWHTKKALKDSIVVRKRH